MRAYGRPRPFGALLAIGIVAACSAACGGGSPLLHPAHALPKGNITAGSGLGNHFTLGPSDDAVEEARQASVDPASTEELDAVLARGAIAHTLSEPGLFPWFGARAGLPGDNEMGILYTGRRARADLRHVFAIDDFALSLGGGITGILPDLGSHQPRTALDGSVTPGESADIPGFDGGSVSGFGLDAPILFGWQSEPSLFALWFGARLTYEQMAADFFFASATGDEVRLAPASGNRLAIGGLVGLAAGVKPVWVRLELDANYERLEGDVTFAQGIQSTRLEGASLTPAGALIVQFK